MSEETMAAKTDGQRIYEVYFDEVGIHVDSWDTLDDVERAPWEAAAGAVAAPLRAELADRTAERDQASASFQQASAERDEARDVVREMTRHLVPVTEQTLANWRERAGLES